MATNWLKPMSAGTVVDGPLGGGAFQDWLATQANTGLPQKPEDAQALWERYMADTGKTPVGFGGGKVPLPDTSKEGILASSLTKMQDVLQKYNDPRWKKFIDAAGINIDKVKAFVNANSTPENAAGNPPDYTKYSEEHGLKNAPSIYPSTTVERGAGGWMDASGQWHKDSGRGWTPDPNNPGYGNDMVDSSPFISSPYRPAQPYKGVERGVLDPSGAVTTPGTMPAPTQNAPKIGRGTGPLGGDPLGLGSILPNQGTTGGYKPSRRRYF